MQSFEQWLEERYLDHGPGDFNRQEDYDNWFWSLRNSYIAGWDACHEDALKMETSTSYVDALNTTTKAKAWFKTSAMHWSD